MRDCFDYALGYQIKNTWMQPVFQGSSIDPCKITFSWLVLKEAHPRNSGNELFSNNVMNYSNFMAHTARRFLQRVTIGESQLCWTDSDLTLRASNYCPKYFYFSHTFLGRFRSIFIGSLTKKKNHSNIT